MFAPNFFNLNIILALRIFENYIPFRVFTFTFRFSMPRRATVRELQYSSVKYIEAPDVLFWDAVAYILLNAAILPEYKYSNTLHTNNLLAYAPNGS